MPSALNELGRVAVSGSLYLRGNLARNKLALANHALSRIRARNCMHMGEEEKKERRQPRKQIALRDPPGNSFESGTFVKLRIRVRDSTGRAKLNNFPRELDRKRKKLDKGERETGGRNALIASIYACAVRVPAASYASQWSYCRCR